MKINKMITLMAISFSINAIADINIFCQNIPLEKSIRSGSNEIEAISLSLKDQSGPLKVDLNFVTLTDPSDPYFRQLTGRTARVSKISLIESNKKGLKVYGVKFDFPYNPEIASVYNRGDDNFFTICRERISK